ncbi:hypothetical protein Tco_1043775 [Tanacetum coccineum]|uniref:Uncharacterized protein n=1 Tax=Tanacetum coccineum TaxID=301880 RepID=A0ABQ5GNN1_9ASTR
MSPPVHASRAKFHWGIAFATGLKRYTDPVLVREMMMISKDGEVSKFPGYHSSEEEEEPIEEGEESIEQPKPYDLYGFVDHPELQMNEFAPHRLPHQEASDKELQAILPEIVTQVTNHVNNANGGDGGNGGNGGNNGCFDKGFLAWYTDQFHELAKLVPHLVTPEAKCIMRYINGLAPHIYGMLRATQPTTIQGAILIDGIHMDKAVRCGTLTRNGEKRKEVGETSWYPKCTKCNALVMHPENA